ncbi:hypothetical protein GS429_09705 [Natronorubrum sp. JWXQ-INN-674]|uniref:Uncharacterized protein n=1 Tax=Natronorubrum halalkaliphilum TaxID=2691917 RepID=A0A6B0VKF9_9EURY|nr:hypothetical protein [Natronorubrum halalkaliphilum]MXV62331.1 hypothetical protein [Natronorubrum halalkaliphilum]
MGLLKNFFIGGARPKVENGEIRCGECREIVQPDAKRCPNCQSDIFTLKGRVLSRLPGLLGLILLVQGSIAGGAFGSLGMVLGLALLGVAVYYFLKAPIYSARPPHRPSRPNR